MSTSERECPRIDEISEWIDGVLTERARADIQKHAVTCLACGAALRDFTAMRARLQALRDTRCEVDIADLVKDRLRPRAPSRQPEGRRKRDFVWHVAPRGLAAAGVLATGVYLGLLLAGGTTVVRPSALAVFDPLPPGGVCAGQPWCESGRR